MDLTGALSKLAPFLAQTAAKHRAIRRKIRPSARREVPCVRQQVSVSEGVLLGAEARYKAGATLREIAADLGVSRPRPPSDADVDEMRRRYAAGESLERIGSGLEFSAGTVRGWLLAEGVAMRDSHGRQR